MSMLSSGAVARSSKQPLRVPPIVGVGVLFDEGVGLAVEDTITLEDRHTADGPACPAPKR